MTDYSIQDLMDRLPAAFLADKAAGVDATVLFNLTGPKGGQWVVAIQNQTCGVEKGTIPNPKLTLTADAQDCLDIFSGKLDGMKAFMQGKLKVSGDFGLAMKLTGLFQP
ncbi:MAG: SCP2 sterol-binding domain-containing protein [Anaerolineaceae bacterium]|nr:SCP2 sterol-binding domain-containing protein [Anaerolineaceae bacterium]